jgi:hypothetical protein
MAGINSSGDTHKQMEDMKPNPQRADHQTEPAVFINERILLTRVPVSRRTVYNWVEAGKLPCVKVNRRKLYHWPSVEAALLRMQRGGVE